MELKTKLQKALTSRIEKEEKDFALYTEKMNGNYINFFENYAEVMYKTAKLLEEYKRLLSSLEECRLDTFMMIAKKTLDRYTRELLTSSLSGCSTSQMHNIAAIASLEANQILISTLQSIINIAEDNYKIWGRNQRV